MGENIGEIIRGVRKSKDLSQRKLSDLSGVDRAYICQLEAGKAGSITLVTARKLAQGLGVSPTIFLGPGAEIQKIDPVKQLRPQTPEELLDRFRIAMPATVPVYDEFPLHASSPVEPVDHVAMVKHRARGKNLEGYIAHGNCLEPDIKDGNIIIVDRDGQIDSGDIVAALVNGELYLARLRKIADEVYLENNNGRIKLEECQVAAPVIEVRRRLK